MVKFTLQDSSFHYSAENEVMENGEVRIRLIADDYTRYIRTVMNKEGSWQKGHFHKVSLETYIVQKGWMVIAKSNGANEQPILYILYPDDIVTIATTVVHNIYLPKEAVIHTIKHGDCAENDWYEDRQFTGLTTSLTEKYILENIKNKDRRQEKHFFLLLTKNDS